MDVRAREGHAADDLEIGRRTLDIRLRKGRCRSPLLSRTEIEKGEKYPPPPLLGRDTCDGGGRGRESESRAQMRNKAARRRGPAPQRQSMQRKAA